MLTAIELITKLKQSHISLRNNEDKYKDLYNKTIKMCAENNTHTSIPDVKRRKVSFIIMIIYIIDESHNITLSISLTANYKK